MKRLAVILTTFTMLAVACSTGGGGPASVVNTASGASHAPVTLQVWSFYTGREFKQYQDVLARFKQLYPWITINHTPAKNDQDIIRAINSGTSPDFTILAGPDNVAKFCATGAYQDLSPYLKADGIDVSKVIPPGALKYTSYNGVQCSLPVLTDAYGLYYNTDMFQKAGIAGPPKTLSELETDAKKLTVFNADGSIKVAGFVPLESFYESYALYYGVYSGAQWYDGSGKSAFASDPRWASLLEWQKRFIQDVYGTDGYHKLTQFVADLGGPDSEWSSSQGFEVGRIAMALDGEWRVAFIQDDKSKVNYATAPFPVPDAQASLYGAGLLGGDVIGIPRGAAHPAEAWLLAKYLALNTQTEEQLAELLKNVPTTYDSLKDPTLTSDPHFDTFLKIFANPNSAFKQLTTIGDADETLWTQFIDKWEAGQVPNLQTGLQDVATSIDKQSQLG